MKLKTFNTFKELEQKLANELAEKLSLSIIRHGVAKILVSGGKTPVGVFHLLSLKQLDWSKVIVGLIDERFVPSNHEASNEKLVRENLLTHEAMNATFVPMMYTEENESKNLEQANLAYETFKEQLTVCLLGMGTDGHVASLFPGDPVSESDLQHSVEGIISTKAPAEPSRRISCSLSMIKGGESSYLLINGATKKQVLYEAIAKKLPVSYFLQDIDKPLQIFYAE